MYEQFVLPVVTYEAETLTKKSAEKLRVGQIRMDRAKLEITKRDRIPNNTIRQRTKVKDLVDHITRMKWRWTGHIKRTSSDMWTKIISEWRPREDKRNRGRPPAPREPRDMEVLR